MTSEQAVLDVPVEFGGLKIGKGTARLGIKIDRSVLNIIAADEIFCGHRLAGRVIKGRSGDSPGQTSFTEDLDEFLDAIFDVKNIRANAGEIGVGFTFSLADVDIVTLSKIANGSGRLVIRDVEDIPEKTKSEKKSEQAPGTLKSEGPWANYPMSKLFSGALLKSLTDVGLNTVGQLADYTKADKPLTDLAGIGPGKAEKIENRLMQFWKDNPDAGMNQDDPSEPGESQA